MTTRKTLSLPKAPSQTGRDAASVSMPRTTRARDAQRKAANAEGKPRPRSAAALPQEKKPMSARPAPAQDAAQHEADGLVRVSKLLAERGICSRREADSYIVRGWVYADGERVAQLGTRVSQEAKLTLDRQAAAQQAQRMTILLHKPIGYVSGQAEDGHQPASVLVTADNQVPSDTLKFRPDHRKGLAPAGRLDIDSTGLLVLTQDGVVARRLIGEDSAIEKEYLVRVEGKLTEEGLQLLNHGLTLDGAPLKPARVKWQNADQLNFVLREGKKRQIRRMCELVGLRVTALKRIRIGKVRLGDLPMGKWRFLRQDEEF